MSISRKSIISICLFLIAASCLFPPYDGKIETGELAGKTVYVGYRFLLTPPEIVVIYEPWAGEPPNPAYNAKVEAEIAIIRLIIQIFVIVLLASGLFLLFSGQRSRRESKTQENPSLFQASVVGGNMRGPLDKLPNMILVALIFCFFTVAYGYLKMAGYGDFTLLPTTIASMTYLIRKAWRYTPKRNRQTS